MEHKDKMQSNRGDQDRPNRESNMEPAEGSRDTVNSNLAGNQGGRGTGTMNEGGELTEEAVGQPDEGGGISNRPIGEEQARQESLPPRGERRASGLAGGTPQGGPAEPNDRARRINTDDEGEERDSPQSAQSRQND